MDQCDGPAVRTDEDPAASEEELSPSDHLPPLYDEFLDSLRREMAVCGREGGEGEGEGGEQGEMEGEGGEQGEMEGEAEGEGGEWGEMVGEGGEQGEIEGEGGEWGEIEGRVGEQGETIGGERETGSGSEEAEKMTEVPLELRDMSPMLQQYLQSLTKHPTPLIKYGSVHTTQYSLQSAHLFQCSTSRSVWKELQAMASM